MTPFSIRGPPQLPRSQNSETSSNFSLNIKVPSNDKYNDNIKIKIIDGLKEWHIGFLSKTNN